MQQDKSHLASVLESLSQCLAQSKRPLGLLLGAGCPVSIRHPDSDSPLIPDIMGLTGVVNQALLANNSDYECLVSRLTDDLDREPNIEEILSHIRGLRLIVGKQEVHGLTGDKIDSLERNVVAQISKAVTVDLPPVHTPYDDLAIWARAAVRDHPIRIFTTNYDLLLEYAFERNASPFFDGFVGAKEPFIDTAAIETDDPPKRWTRLVKLHGSSNWAERSGRGVVRMLPSNTEEPRLIHPSHLKYGESRRMPFLLMFDQLEDFLRTESATLIIVGYSFRDDHINDVLSQAMRSNASAKLFGLQYGRVENYDKALQLAREHYGLTVVAFDGGIDAGLRIALWPDEQDEEDTFDLGDFINFGKHLCKSVGRKGEGLLSGADTKGYSDVE